MAKEIPQGAAAGPALEPEEFSDPVFVPYVYTAEVLSVYDADTITIEIDLGFHVKAKQKVRLFGIDAWEVRGAERPQGLIARDWMREQIPAGSKIMIKTIKDKTGKYGRYLAIVYVKTATGYRNLNRELVTLGYAEYKEY
tara:strand:+ start:2473 stop:2892 length:420 start_codon:yes stop_codon:yes gene_type:complete